MVVPSANAAEAPAFSILQNASSVTFHVKASVPIRGRFEKWTSVITFTSPEVSTGVLDVKIDADSVNTGSGVKDRKIKSADFFDVKNNPLITFRSRQISQTGPDTFVVAGDLTMRGVTKPETLVLKATRQGSAGEVTGTMSVDRKEFGMNGSVPLIQIADRVDVTVDLKARRVSGPPLALKP
jgi:polyisoprenoid-binding protein YceI